MQRSIFVTGAASGIGRATARLFAERGWLVGVEDFDDEGVRRLAAELDPARVHTPMVANQAYAAAVYKNLKARGMTAEQVAEVVWKAAHGRRIHWLPSSEVRRYARASRLSTRLARSVMKRMASHQ